MSGDLGDVSSASPKQLAQDIMTNAQGALHGGDAQAANRLHADSVALNGQNPDGTLSGAHADLQKQTQDELNAKYQADGIMGYSCSSHTVDNLHLSLTHV